MRTVSLVPVGASGIPVRLVPIGVCRDHFWCFVASRRLLYMFREINRTKYLISRPTIYFAMSLTHAFNQVTNCFLF